MVFKKVLTSSGQPIIIGSTLGEDEKFPPGFSYRVGGLIYTVRKNVTQEVNSSMREVTLSDGTTEIIPVESIVKDLKEPDCEILPFDERFIKKAAGKTSKKKIAKKKNKSKKKSKKEK